MLIRLHICLRKGMTSFVPTFIIRSCDRSTSYARGVKALAPFSLLDRKTHASATCGMRKSTAPPILALLLLALISLSQYSPRSLAKASQAPPRRDPAESCILLHGWRQGLVPAKMAVRHLGLNLSFAKPQNSAAAAAAPAANFGPCFPFLLFARTHQPCPANLLSWYRVS